MLTTGRFRGTLALDVMTTQAPTSASQAVAARALLSAVVVVLIGIVIVLGLISPGAVAA